MISNNIGRAVDKFCSMMRGGGNYKSAIDRRIKPHNYQQ